jgi:uncharacterized RDD family membrane protein YckC
MKGKALRLTNFLLDSSIFFILLILFILAFKDVLAIENIKWISIVLYFLYYLLFEYFFHQTIGKMITKSRVVSSSKDHQLSFMRLVLRTLMRFIPIDIISYLFAYRGLHDLVSSTSVIKVESGEKSNIIM